MKYWRLFRGGWQLANGSRGYKLWCAIGFVLGYRVLLKQSPKVEQTRYWRLARTDSRTYYTAHAYYNSEWPEVIE